MDTIKVIAKKYVDDELFHIEEARSNNCYVESFYIELFFPEYLANDGYIAAWDGCHGEASLDYFNEGVVVPIPQELKARYEKHYDCQLVEVKE